MPPAASTMTGAVVTSSSSITRGLVSARYAFALRIGPMRPTLVGWCAVTVIALDRSRGSEAPSDDR